MEYSKGSSETEARVHCLDRLCLVFGAHRRIGPWPLSFFPPLRMTKGSGGIERLRNGQSPDGIGGN